MNSVNRFRPGDEKSKRCESFLLLPAVNAQYRRCFANEEFNACASPCEATCKEPSRETCPGCAATCECKPGFLRNEYGACVNDCDNLQTLRPTCNANEEFKDCGTACEPTCWNPKPENCSKMCVPGCQCKEGYFRNGDDCTAECENDDNVTATNQPPTNQPDVPCPENEELVECGGPCESTCESPAPVNPDCIYDCIGVICRCREGLARNSEDKCIPQKECTYSGEEFPNDSLDTGIASADSCDDVKCPEGTACSIEDRCLGPPCPVVVCNPSSQSSSETCGPNELLKECFGCEPTCDHMNPNCEVTCGRPRCVCEEGFARTSFGECVEKKNCFYPGIEDRPSVPVESNPFYRGSSVMCGRNEVSESCFGCEPTCDSMKPDCEVICGSPTCVCEEGFFRSFLGDCVTKDECSFLLDQPDVSDSDLLPQGSSWMCGPNELLKKCFGCEPSCLHMDPAPKRKRTRIAISTYNARTLASEAAIEDLMMQLKKIKYDVIGLTETRRRHPLNVVYETGGELFLGTYDSRGVGGVGVLVNTNMAKNIDSFEELTTRIGRLRMRRCGPTPALTIFVAYAAPSSY